MSEAINELVGTADGPQLTIIEADVTIDDSNALFIDQTNNEIWLDYMSYNRYEKDYRRYMMGVASPNGFAGSSVAFVQLAAPTLLWICEWTALKAGAQPEIPTNASPTGWVLLQEFPELPMCKVGPDGVTPIYRVSGVYVYGSTNPSVTTVADLSFPKPAWLKDGLDRTMPSSKLTAGLSTPSTGGTGSSIGAALAVPYVPPGLIKP